MAPQTQNSTTSPEPESTETLLIGRDRWPNDPVSECRYQTTLVGWSLKLNAPVYLAVTCRQWTCRFCGEMRAKRLAAITAAAEPTTLITLTTNPACWDTPRDAFDGTRRQSTKLHQSIRRLYGSFEYLKVMELTKKGWPHWHYVARCGYIPQHWLSDRWNELTGAPVVDIRKIKASQDAYWYVVKYLSKQRYCQWTKRRATMSRRYDLEPEKKKVDPLHLVDCRIIHTSVRNWMHLHLEGHRVKRIGTLAWTTCDPQEETTE